MTVLIWVIFVICLSRFVLAGGGGRHLGNLGPFAALADKDYQNYQEYQPPGSKSGG